MYTKDKAFRTYLRKKINTGLATRLGEDLYNSPHPVRVSPASRYSS